MRESESVFVDTGAWIALALSRDPLPRPCPRSLGQPERDHSGPLVAVANTADPAHRTCELSGRLLGESFDLNEPLIDLDERLIKEGTDRSPLNERLIDLNETFIDLNEQPIDLDERLIDLARSSTTLTRRSSRRERTVPHSTRSSSTSMRRSSTSREAQRP